MNKVIILLIILIMLTINASAITVICRGGVNCEENMALMNTIPEELLEGIEYVEFTNYNHPTLQGEYFYSYKYDTKTNKITEVTNEKIIIYSNAQDKLWVLHHEVSHHLETKLFHGQVLSESIADQYADNKTNS